MNVTTLQTAITLQIGELPRILRPLNFPPIQLQQLQITPKSTQSSTAEMQD